MAPPVADYVPMFKAPPQTKINLGRMLFHPSSTLQTLVEFMPSQRLTKTLCIFTSFFTFKKNCHFQNQTLQEVKLRVNPNL